MTSRCLLVLLLLSPGIVAAEVVDSGAGGFTVEHRVVANATREQAWQATVDGIGHWWNGDHTVSGDAANLYIDPRPLGCFCERLGERSGLVHLVVTFVNPGVMLRLTGGLGPLGLMGVNGNFTLEYEDAADDGSQVTITLRYAVGGYRAGGLDALAAPVDGVLGEQLRRLAAYLDSGRAAGG
ncbi:MAG: SRPBCC family protein [Woeseiaceae bacterium]|nr:SRPBCC family protein [Woeseiaceae bacterium]